MASEAAEKNMDALWSEYGSVLLLLLAVRSVNNPKPEHIAWAEGKVARALAAIEASFI